jgi:hypothetical protein
MIYALRGARAGAAGPLAAAIAQAIARVALAALGLSDDPVHEPVHGAGALRTRSGASAGGQWCYFRGAEGNVFERKDRHMGI